ncbi:hypothetical protein [Pedobacter heparinus]|uniref:hypothetical protein n=1 Tax=Pedobacter heparinus TaxID=984 RepID=UPI002930E727|nr:hypothetical protein [Pedobacter heparinus]
MYKPTIKIELKLDDYFKAAFPDELIPDNSNIDKNKTGLGITTAELKACRHSLLAIPSTTIIDDKHFEAMEKGWNTFRIYEGVTTEQVAEFLSDASLDKKILTTPESFWRVIKAAENIGKLQWLYDNFFCYLDESHCYAVDRFRDEEMLTPFDYFFRFKKKAMGTATFFEYSDPRIRELQKYEMTYSEKLGTINVVHHNDPQAVLNYFLKNPQLTKGNVFIFFNTVTQCGEAVINADIKSVSNIYCREDEKNLINLGEAALCFKTVPVKAEFKKFNFFSCRYNEGWDLKDDENATIILVTDIGVPHSLVGIPFRGFQAVGRLREYKPDKIYHFTNTHDKSNQFVRSIDDIRKTRWYHAERNIEYYINCNQNCRGDKMPPDADVFNLVKPYLKFENGKATVHPYKLDQLIYEDWVKEFYASLDSVKLYWERCNYNVKFQQFDVADIKRYRKSKAQINQEVIEQYDQLIHCPEQYLLGQANVASRRLKQDYNTLIEAYHILGKTRLQELNYEDNKIMQQLSAISNKNQEAKLYARLLTEFKLNGKYTKKEIKKTLQSIYDELMIKDKAGKRKVATASQLKEIGIFGIKDGKNAYQDHVFIITAVYAIIKQAA